MFISGNTWTSLGFELLTESYHDKQVNKAAEYIQQKHPRLIGLEITQAGNPKTAKDLANDVVHYIPVLVAPNPGSKRGKFIYGAVRIFYDELEFNHRDIKDTLGKLIKTLIHDGHEAEYDENLNGLSFDELENQFGSAARQFSNNEREQLSNRQWNRNPNYQIVQIKNTEEAKKYVPYLNPSNVWCITKNQSFYDNYAGEFGVFYFVLKNGFQNVARVQGPNHPHDDYGESMMAVCVDEHGDFVNCTCRWNGSGDFHTPEQLSEILGGNFYELFPPLSTEERLKTIKENSITISEAIKWMNGRIKDYGRGPFDMLNKGLECGCEFIDNIIIKQLEREYEAVKNEKRTPRMYGIVNGEILSYGYAFTTTNYLLYNNQNGKLISNQSFKTFDVTNLPYDIEKIEIPAETEEIDTGFGYSWPQALTEITVSPENNIFYSKNNLIFNKKTGELITARFRLASRIVIPTGVEKIGNGAFSGMKRLVNVEIPNSVTSIGNWAFSLCTSLEEISIPGTIKHIPTNMCSNCSNLKRVILGNGIREIGTRAFHSDSLLNEITIPSSVYKIGRGAFESCYNLSIIKIESENVDIDKFAFDLWFVKKIIVPDNYNTITLDKIFSGEDKIKTKVFTSSGKKLRCGVNTKRRWYNEDEDDDFDDGDSSEYDKWYEAVETKTTLVESWGTPWQRITSQLID